MMDTSSRQSSEHERAQSSYSSTLDAVWATVKDIQEDYHYFPEFRAERYDKTISKTRHLIADAAHTSDGEQDAESFRDYHQLSFLHDALHAIVYAPQLSKAAPEEAAIHLTDISLGIQLAATQALVRIRKDPEGLLTPKHKSNRHGFANELTVLALLNRPAVSKQTGRIAVPAHRDLDLYKATDSQWVAAMQTLDETAHIDLQIKSSRRPTDRAPRDGVIIYSDMFSIHPGEAERLITFDFLGSNSRLLTLDQRGAKLARRVMNLSRPEVRARQQRERHRIRQEARLQSGDFDLKQRIGDIAPSLQDLKDSLS